MSTTQLAPLIALLRERNKNVPTSVEGMRDEFEQMMGRMPLDPGVTRENIHVGAMKAAWFTPGGCAPDEALLYLHGGGYVIGSIDTHAALTGNIARAAGMRAVSIDYRLAPEHKHPAAVEDSVTAYQWLLDQGYAAEKLVIAGDSAGGGLTVATLVALRDKGLPLPRAAAILSPWVDLEATGESMKTRAEEDPLITPRSVVGFGRLYAGPDQLQSPLAAPLHADLTGLPRLLVQVGTAEVLLDDAIRIAERLEAAGVDTTLEVYEGMIHVWHFFSHVVDEGAEAIERVGNFLKRS